MSISLVTNVYNQSSPLSLSNDQQRTTQLAVAKNDIYIGTISVWCVTLEARKQRTTIGHTSNLNIHN